MTTEQEPTTDTAAIRPNPNQWAMEKVMAILAEAKAEMTEGLAVKFADALTLARAEGDPENLFDLAQYRLEAENLLRRCDKRMQRDQAQLREAEARLEVFDTMRRLFDAGRGGNMGIPGEESLSWLIREMLAHGSPYPAAMTEGRSR